MKSVLVLLSVILSVVTVLSAPKNCNKGLFDTHAANVFAQFGLEELPFPENTGDLSKYCKQSKTSTDFAKQYGENCLKGTSQTLMALATYNFDKVNKPYCAKKGSKRDVFIKWGTCGNRAKPHTKKCWDTMILTMAMADKVKNSKSRIPLVCCTYYEWIKCTNRELVGIGESICSKDAIDGYNTHIHKASVDSMNLICSKYEDDPVKCAALKTEVPAGPKPKKLQKTPLLYVFDLFDKL